MNNPDIARMAAERPALVSTMRAVARSRVGKVTYNKSLTKATITVTCPKHMSVKSFKVQISVDDMDSVSSIQESIARSMHRHFPSVRKLVSDYRRSRHFTIFEWRWGTFRALDGLMPSGTNLFDRIIETFEKERRSGAPDQLHKDRQKRIALDAIRRAVLKASGFGASRKEIRLAFSVLDVAEVMEEA